MALAESPALPDVTHWLSMWSAGPLSQVSPIKQEASDGGLHVLFTNLLGKLRALFKMIFFSLETQPVILSRSPNSTHKTPHVPHVSPSPQQN